MTPFATALELETHLQRTPLDQALADLALAGASGVVRDYCGWVILRESVTFLLDVDTFTPVLNLPTLLLVDVQEIRVDGVVIDATVTPQPRWTTRGQIFWPWPGACKVEADVVHGHLDVPDLIRLITLTVAARIINNPDDVKQSAVSTVARTYDTTLSALELRLLDPYRL